MDGRVQLPVTEFLQTRFGVRYVDAVTEPGPNRIIAEQTNSNLVESILARVKISVERHESVGIAIAGHHDCAGNPADKDRQISHVMDAVSFMRRHCSDIEVIGLWVDEAWTVSEITPR